MNDTTKQQLTDAAKSAAQNSYSNYSNFPVGAALMTDDGTIYTGCNIENASYGLSNCGERTAIFKAVSDGHRKISAVAVNCLKGDPSVPATLMPCGACRQVMREFMDDDAIILVAGVGEFTLADLLPHAFHL